MKNRNIPYYVAALMLAAGVSTSFVSCVDTEEPDSIVTLRNAKAEEIKAEAKVQEALAVLKEAEAAYKKAEERAKIADAVTTELNNKLLEVTNNLEADKITGKHDLEVAKAKETAQKELDAAKQEAALALADYDRALKEAQLKAKIAYQEMLADGVKADKGHNKNLAEYLETYNKALDALADANKTLQAAIDDADTKASSEDALQTAVNTAQKALDDAKDAKADFEKLALDTEVQSWITKYLELDAKIKAAKPTQRTLKYEAEDLKQQKIAEDKKNPGSDAYKEEVQKKEQIVFEVPEKLQTALAAYSDEYFEYKTETKSLEATKDIKNGEYEKATKDGILQFLQTNYLNKITSEYSEYTVKDAKAAYEKQKEVDEKDGSAYKKWDAAVKAYKEEQTEANKTKLGEAMKNYFGVESLTGGTLILSLPSYDDLVEFYGGDEDKAKAIYYAESVDFGKLNNARKNYEDAQLTEAASTLKKSIADAVKVVTDQIAALDKAKADMEASEEYKALLAKIEKNQKDQDELNTDAAEALRGEIEKMSLKYAGITFKEDGSVQGVTGTDFKELANYDDEKFKADVKKATDLLDAKITTATNTLKRKQAQLDAFKEAVEKNDFSHYYETTTVAYAKAIVDAQKTVNEKQKAVDTAKAEYEAELGYYKAN